MELREIVSLKKKNFHAIQYQVQFIICLLKTRRYQGPILKRMINRGSLFLMGFGTRK